MALLPSSSSSTREFNYHVFLSCEIKPALDLEVVDEIKPALEEAIQTSRIAIVVLSKNYASSSFCLDKFSKFLDHFKTKVHPVFYQVAPDDGEAMAMHNDRIPKWTMALQRVANLPGGLESRVQKVIQLLDLESGGGVHMVGIIGIGGIGKTVLAEAVYNLIADQFEVVCFLHCLTGKSNEDRLVQLQERLLDEIVGEGEEGVKVTCLSEGIEEIRRRLCRKKVLLILDDVHELEHLQALAGGPDWFGLGSRVIITTRNKHLLVSHGIERIYEVSELNDEEALDLLTLYAFKNKIAHSEYKEVLNCAVTFASGLPLSLKVIGFELRDRSVLEWKSYLHKWKRVPHEIIQAVQKWSFDHLETTEKCVFLDIACCFKGYSLVEVQYILRAHYSNCVTDYISALVRKSIANISSSGELTLHESMRNMGKGILQRKSEEMPEELSRLWIPKDILRVLKDCKGTDNIEIIYLDLSSTEEGMIVWDGEGFMNMGNLKTLIIKNANFSQAPRHLPSSLRVLEWQRYPSQYLPPNFHPENLAICKLPKRCFVSSEISGLLNKKPLNLDDLSFDNGEHSNEMLYVSCLPKSEEISVRVSY